MKWAISIQILLGIALLLWGWRIGRVAADSDYRFAFPMVLGGVLILIAILLGGFWLIAWAGTMVRG